MARAHQLLVRADAADHPGVHPVRRSHPPGRPRKGAPNDPKTAVFYIILFRVDLHPAIG